MTEGAAGDVVLPADANQIDDTGFVWTFLNEATDYERVVPGAVIVAGDSVEPFVARVVDIVVGTSGQRIVHLDLLGLPE